MELHELLRQHRTLAIEFVHLAGHPDPASSLDLSALFKGTT